MSYKEVLKITVILTFDLINKTHLYYSTKNKTHCWGVYFKYVSANTVWIVFINLHLTAKKMHTILFLKAYFVVLTKQVGCCRKIITRNTEVVFALNGNYKIMPLHSIDLHPNANLIENVWSHMKLKGKSMLSHSIITVLILRWSIMGAIK